MTRRASYLLPAFLLAAVLILASCGTGGGTQGGSDDSGGSGGEMSGMDMGETTGGMEGTEGMEAMDMGSEEMARQMLTEDGGYSDENFIDQMVPHHRGAMEEARVAIENAEHEELRNLAEGIIAGQRREIGEMKDIKAEEYGTRQVPMQMSSEEMEMMGMMEDPQALADAEPFDHAFMNNMIPHHQSAIAMAEVALEESENPEVRSIARNIVDSQQSEIEQMKQWCQQWYPEG